MVGTGPPRSICAAGTETAVERPNIALALTGTARHLLRSLPPAEARPASRAANAAGVASLARTAVGPVDEIGRSATMSGTWTETGAAADAGGSAPGPSTSPPPAAVNETPPGGAAGRSAARSARSRVPVSGFALMP